MLFNDQNSALELTQNKYVSKACPGWGTQKHWTLQHNKSVVGPTEEAGLGPEPDAPHHPHPVSSADKLAPNS